MNLCLVDLRLLPPYIIYSSEAVTLLFSSSYLCSFLIYISADDRYAVQFMRGSGIRR